MHEEAFRPGPEGKSEVRRELEWEIWKEELQKIRRWALAFSLIGVAVYFAWTRTRAPHLVPSLVFKVLNWGVQIFGLVCAFAIMGLTCIESNRTQSLSPD